jgi:ribonuclease HI
MELQAVLEALKALDGPLLLQTDSKYVRDTFTVWLALWKQKGILHKKENTDLILEIDRLRQERGVKWEWVRGHDGHPLNEKADSLAKAAASTFGAAKGASTGRPTNNRPSRPRGFPAAYAGTCGNCAVRYPPGTLIVKNSSGRYVHAGGCRAR